MRHVIEWLQAIVNTLHHGRDILRLAGVKKRDFVFSVGLSALASFVALIEMRFLLAIIMSAVRDDFSHLVDGRYVGPLFRLIPVDIANQTQMLITMVMAFFVAVVIGSLLNYTSTVLINRQKSTSKIRVQQLVFEQMLLLGKTYYDQHGFADLQHMIITRANRCVEILGIVHFFLKSTLHIVAFAAVLSIVSIPMTALTLACYLLASLGCLLVSHSIRQSNHEEMRAALDHNKKIYHVLSCIPLIQSYVKESEEIEHYNELTATEMSLRERTNQRQILIKELQHMLMIGVMILVTVTFITQGDLLTNVSAILPFLIIVRLMGPHFEHATNALISLGKNEQFAKTVLDLLKEPQAKWLVQEGAKQFYGLKNSIEFTNVTFAYPQRKPLLRNVTFSIPRGKMTAIVGPTGAGKTTIAHLLTRFYEYSKGDILLDGVSIREFSRKSLREHITLVSQDIFLFNETLEYNIHYGAEQATSSDIDNTIERTQLANVLRTLPNGLDTVVGDRGVTLSGGERQRTSLTRSLLRSGDVIILDEPTSALDSRTEKLLQEAISELVAEKTLLVFAHRLSTIAHADQIIVLHDGGVAESGTFYELMAQRGLLYEYWEAQHVAPTPQ